MNLPAMGCPDTLYGEDNDPVLTGWPSLSYGDWDTAGSERLSLSTCGRMLVTGRSWLHRKDDLFSFGNELCESSF